MTPHINAKKDDIAKIVLMPGDPLRAKYIAENFLEPNFKEVNNIRGMLAFTGKYKGKDVTIMGHGMGNPSIGIYSYELFKFYDVDVIIRIGSCGSYLEEMNLGDLVLASNAISNSVYADNMLLTINNQTVSADEYLLTIAKDVLKDLNYQYYDGLVLSSDNFYGKSNGGYIDNLIAKKQIYAVEMEAFALYVNARILNKRALTILTVSDSLVNHKEMTADERRTSFKAMMNAALEIVKKWYEKNE